MTTTAIAAVVLRQRSTVRGRVVCLESSEHPVVTDYKISDGTGTLVLRFFGRASVPGLVPGRLIVAEGTAGLVDGIVVMINPIYSFAGAG